ncbi:hypothetical protein F5884DRAFT_825515 [Xylogone sp. PMI_703]|nr:hypothetical protein F5884DRAFT_825515 [Xylogone sp. PMI_703]
MDSSPLTLGHLKELLLELTGKKSESPDLVKVSEAVQTDTPKPVQTRASRLEVKLVDDVWDTKSSTWKIVESPELPEKLDQLDEYVLVDHRRVDKKTAVSTYYVEIKSITLQDILKTVLQDVKGVSLQEDKPQIERNLLHSYLAELEEYRKTAKVRVHLDVLIDYLKRTYKTTMERLSALLKLGEITYDLLPFLFRPNMMVYTISPGIKKPMCFRYDFGQERITQDDETEYLHIEGRYLDSDGKVFGESEVETAIVKFRGSKPIKSLRAFPLAYHQDEEKIKADLVARGQKFVALSSICHYHYYYRGMAFKMEKGKPVKISVDSRIVVDATYFLQVNPNYSRPTIVSEIKKRSNPHGFFDLWDYASSNQANEGKIKGIDRDRLKEDDFLLCCPSVLGFSLSDGLWLEFAIDDIADINWNASLIKHLAISDKNKRLIQALVTSHVNQVSDHSFDDFVAGKGQGLIMLFYGPPGVGKTLTAEAVSEHLQRPLYIISAGELGNDPQNLEKNLSTILELADHWKAILLLDEADVFMRKRGLDHNHNSLVSVFLRKLEYYRGIMLLTTNRVEDFDEAIRSRIHLAIKYQPLGIDTRKVIWKNFLRKATTAQGDAKYDIKELGNLAKNDLNGRQIKNVVRAAHALATNERVTVSHSHLETVIDAGKEFEAESRGVGQTNNMQSYF